MHDQPQMSHIFDAKNSIVSTTDTFTTLFTLTLASLKYGNKCLVM